LTRPPPWLAAWRDQRLPPEAALARFDALYTVAPEAMLGRWRGRGLATGHPFDGLLEALGWYGKDFVSTAEVHPLLFDLGGRVVALDPALMPATLAWRRPWIAPRSAAARRIFRMIAPGLAARGPGARLEARAFRGRTSAAMVYLRQPITDHFRSVDGDRMLGLMEMRGMDRPYFFLLDRDR
jgi:hypothetical protein